MRKLPADSRARLRAAWAAELDAARAARSSGDTSSEWTHLERAHILSQPMAVAHVRTHGIGFILDTQDNLLPHLILGPAVGRWGLHGALTVTILSLLVLAAIVSYLTCRITGSMAGAAAAAVALVALPPVTDRTGFVPMYPTMLALGYLGAWLAYRTMTADRRP